MSPVVGRPLCRRTTLQPINSLFGFLASLVVVSIFKFD